MIITTIIGWITGSLTNKIADAYIAREQAKTDAERLKHDERIHNLEARRDIVLETQKHLAGRLVRAAFAIPFIAFLWKVIIWDKVLGLGTTDALDPNLWDVCMVILGGYFLTTAVSQWRR